MRKDTGSNNDWSGRLETLEQRLALSGVPLGSDLGGTFEHHVLPEEPMPIEHHAEATPDFWVDYNDEQLIEHQLDQIEQTLASAHEWTGLNDVRGNYGFKGTGQTVAVIDSGIAYDHYALGSGFGSDYRVVGGWDFTEGDADPYDDGPSGSHGTHVAGIVGSTDETNQGVSPGVDLVGLRVFDDSGAGYFSWAEEALQWVYWNRNEFDNPITTVNLSLGVSTWNDDEPPSWAMLEDEFELLKNSGIVVTVSAGNSYPSFNEPGLSYPAASPYVVPVMAHDASGDLAWFSQRHSRAIAAPGTGVTSTVPDYKGDGNGTTDDFATFSGTSMASPYVAGASVLIREAMDFVGNTNITQDTIYNHIVDTAVSFYDSSTDAWYNRLDLGAAIDALMPTDDYGSTVDTAYELQSLDSSLSGVVSTLDDVDYFKFTASQTGTVSFTASNITHNLAASWTDSTGSGSVSGDQGETYTLDVVAGQDYAVGLSTSDGLGYYDLGIESTAAFTFEDWGAVSFAELSNLSFTDEAWYRIEASQDGYLTAESFFDAQGGQIDLKFYDANLELVDTGNASNGTSRVDFYATAGEEYFLSVLGSNSDVDFRLTNLVSVTDTIVQVAGTSAADQFTFTAGDTHTLSVNGTSYTFASIAVTDVNFNGGAGSDNITMTGTTGDETAVLKVGEATLEGSGYKAKATGVENVTMHGGGGEDRADLYDSVGDDVLTTHPTKVVLQGEGFEFNINNYFRVYTFATAGGSDSAYLNGSSQDDTLTVGPQWAWYSSSEFVHHAKGFDRIETYGHGGGYDRAYMHGSEGDDTLTAGQNWAWFSGTDFVNYAKGFDRVNSYGEGGSNDRAFLHDSPGDDVFTVMPAGTWFSGEGFLNYATGFSRVNAYSDAGGFDRAFLYDSAGDDVFTATPTGAWFTSAGFVSHASQFDQVHAITEAGGYDRAYLYDSAGDDIAYVNSSRVTLRGSGFNNSARNFEQTRILASSGFDKADFDEVVAGEKVQGINDLSQVARLQAIQKIFGFDHITAHTESKEELDINLDDIDYVFERVGLG